MALFLHLRELLQNCFIHAFNMFSAITLNKFRYDFRVVLICFVHPMSCSQNEGLMEMSILEKKMSRVLKVTLARMRDLLLRRNPLSFITFFSLMINISLII